MNHKSLAELTTIEEVRLEISLAEGKLKKLPKRAVKEILVMTVLAILFPFIPRKRGRGPMVENWEYSDAMILVAITFTITYLIAYQWRKDKLQKRVRDLKLKEHLMQKEKFK